MPTIEVHLPSESYSIIIEAGLLRRLGRATLDVAPAKRAMLAIDSAIVSNHGATARESLQAKGYEVAAHHLTADEAHKTLETARAMYAAMIAARLERSSPVIALGGGVVGDLAGFAAATYLRGLPVIQVPTTLLAMVDASIGGKTGVNFPRPDGPLAKNIIGAFWQPRAVLIDPQVLRTLDPRDLRCGFAECIKHALIADADLLTFIADNAARLADLDMPALVELIDRSVKIKVAIVQEDVRESGRRALLNLGHTFAHAIEPIDELDLRHGEAVSIGLAAALRCAAALRRIDSARERLVVELLELLELPTRLSQPIAVGRLMDAMSYDKKVDKDRLRLVLPLGLGKAEIVTNVPPGAIVDAWLAVGAAPGAAGPPLNSDGNR